VNIKEKLSNKQKQWAARQPLNPTLQHQIDQQFMIDFNYNSNHLEGNTLTYGQTKMLLLFGRVEGPALMRDLEEMKAHNVGLEMMKREAVDKTRLLSENFIRELNNIILAGDFYKTSHDGEYRYKIHAGIYKTRPNSVITPSGEMFDYASPEETPSLMTDLVAWYRTEEERGALTPVELAALFHFRCIRIHPFEDGNGRIARLIVNYILLRHGYPMFVIPAADRRNYLDALGKCDKIAGKLPYDGANATIEQITPLVDYMAAYVSKKLDFALDIADGKIRKFAETQVRVDELGVKLGVKLGVNQIKIIELMLLNNTITSIEMANILAVSEVAIYKNIKKLRELNIVTRNGSDKDGFWEVNMNG
jgi:Fic family protein